MAADPLEKLEAAVRKLAVDVGGHQKTLDGHSKRLDEHTELLNEHTELLNEHTDLLNGIASSVEHIRKTQVALTNAMTTAIKQLGVGKSLEIRVKRLEDTVFGAKH